MKRYLLPAAALLLIVSFIAACMLTFAGTGNALSVRTRRNASAEAISTGRDSITDPLKFSELLPGLVSININTADLDTLTALPGIGESLAQAVIDYRSSNGPFSSPEELMNVSGIGESKYNAIAAMITTN